MNIFKANTEALVATGTYHKEKKSRSILLLLLFQNKF